MNHNQHSGQRYGHGPPADDPPLVPFNRPELEPGGEPPAQWRTELRIRAAEHHQGHEHQHQPVIPTILPPDARAGPLLRARGAGQQGRGQGRRNSGARQAGRGPNVSPGPVRTPDAPLGRGSRRRRRARATQGSGSGDASGSSDGAAPASRRRLEAGRGQPPGGVRRQSQWVVLPGVGPGQPNVGGPHNAPPRRTATRGANDAQPRIRSAPPLGAADP